MTLDHFLTGINCECFSHLSNMFYCTQPHSFPSPPCLIIIIIIIVPPLSPLKSSLQAELVAVTLIARHVLAMKIAVLEASCCSSPGVFLRTPVTALKSLLGTKPGVLIAPCVELQLTHVRGLERVRPTC